MNEAFVLHDADGFHVYRHIGATHAQRIGPAFAKPRQAIDYAHALDAGREVSPLRLPREGVTDLAGAGALSSRDADALTGSPETPPGLSGTPSRSVTPAGAG